LPFPLLEQQPVVVAAASLEVGLIPFQICAVVAQDFA
jgi:hypothetical protein